MAWFALIDAPLCVFVSTLILLVKNAEMCNNKVLAKLPLFLVVEYITHFYFGVIIPK